MQEFENEKLVDTQIMDSEEELKLREERLGMKPGSTHKIIGYIPKAGDSIIINGLRYKILNADSIKGRFVAQIEKPGATF
jgi:Mg2+/Co2+ transporter CorC